MGKEMSSNFKNSKYYVPNLERVLTIIELIAEHRGA